MKDGGISRYTHKIQKEITEGLTVDNVIDCPEEHLNSVLEDWEKLKKNFGKVAILVGQTFYAENPFLKDLSPGFAKVPHKDLPRNQDFLIHSNAIMKGLDTIFDNLSGKYEEDNEILPIIGMTHRKRGITRTMMNNLKESLCNACCDYLNSSKRGRRSWRLKKETQLKKLLSAVITERRNSSEECETENALEEPNKINPQVIPSPVQRKQSTGVKTSPTLSERRPSRSFLHPDHAKFMVQRRSSLLTPPLERYSLSFEGGPRAVQNGGFSTSPLSSSAASSITSISNGTALGSHASDPLQNYDSRRSSTMTNKYSLLDALDLEYALIKAAARGSIGPYSLSQSLQKLTFTQSLAFPALARGISNKKNSSQSSTRGPLDPLDSGVNAFAKVATVLVLVLISVLVFGVLYKFIRT